MLEDRSRYEQVDSSTYAEIESAIICNATEERLNAFPYTAQHFSVHGEAFNWLKNFVDTYKKFPTLIEIEVSYPTIDTKMAGITWEHTLDIFKKQVLYRYIEGAVSNKIKVIRAYPQKALIDLIMK